MEDLYRNLTLDISLQKEEIQYWPTSSIALALWKDRAAGLVRLSKATSLRKIIKKKKGQSYTLTEPSS